MRLGGPALCFRDGGCINQVNGGIAVSVGCNSCVVVLFALVCRALSLTFKFPARLVQ